MATQENRKVLRNNYHDHISLRLPGDQYKNHMPDLSMKEDFKFYTMDLSYFAGKLEMYFRYKELSFDRVEPDAAEFDSILWANTGTEQLPQVFDARKDTPPEKRWLRDTTPIIEHLEKDPAISKVSLPVIPECPVQAFFHRLIEDYADEYLWRPAMYWRWEPGFDRRIMGLRFYYEFARTTQWRYIFYPPFLRPFLLSLRQWLLSSWGEDCTTQAKKDIVKEQYYELLDILQEILSQQPYLFGNRPTLVDFGFAGPFFRHFASDFSPRKVMQHRGPAVFEWIGRMWNSKCSKMMADTGFPAAGQLPANWHRLLSLLPDYLEYSHLNAVAYKNGQKTFSWVNKGETFNVPVVHYRVWCRQQLQRHYTDSPVEAQERIKELLVQHKCWDLLWRDGVVHTEPECGIAPPFAVYPPNHAVRIAYKWDANRIFARYFFEIGVTSAVVLGVGQVVGGVVWTLLQHS